MGGVQLPSQPLDPFRPKVVVAGPSTEEKGAVAETVMYLLRTALPVQVEVHKTDVPGADEHSQNTLLVAVTSVRPVAFCAVVLMLLEFGVRDDAVLRALASALQHRRLLQAEAAEIEQADQQQEEDGHRQGELDDEVAQAIGPQPPREEQECVHAWRSYSRTLPLVTVVVLVIVTGFVS